jgi:hypothetical protein
MFVVMASLLAIERTFEHLRPNWFGPVETSTPAINDLRAYYGQLSVERMSLLERQSVGITPELVEEIQDFNARAAIHNATVKSKGLEHDRIEYGLSYKAVPLARTLDDDDPWGEKLSQKLSVTPQMP